MLGTRATAVRETIADLCEAPPETGELVREVAERLRRVVPFDTGAWMTTDPETLVPTDMYGIDTTLELSVALREDEMRGEDVNSFGEMHRRGRLVATLAGETGGQLDRSPRYRTIHVPHNLGDELRLLARDGSDTWALVCLSRGEDAPSFSAEEVRYVGEIGELLGRGIRTSLARRPPEAERLDALGVLVVRADDTVEASTGQAMRWLQRLPPAADGAPLPTAISMVSMMARAQAVGAPGARPARLRMRLSNGGWLLVHADVLDGGEPGKTAVVLEPADRAQLLPLLFSLHGLTSRERQVAELLITGRSTDEIAEALHISRHTLRDHVKAIFAKVGVSSRPELTAALAA
jgi:DNA-binding CsgD family transcriptional regulator